MWTSTARKPARVNAAAISTWPLTPCSRSTATAGRAPRATNGAAMSSAGSKVNAGARPGSAASAIRSNSWSASAGLSRNACIACVVADHARWRSTRDSSRSTVAPRRTRIRPSSVGRADADRVAHRPPRSAPPRAVRPAREPGRRRPTPPRRASEALPAAAVGSSTATPTATREGHLRERHEQPPIADVRGKPAAVSSSRRRTWIVSKKRGEPRAESSMSGHSWPSWPYACASAELPSRSLPLPERPIHSNAVSAGLRARRAASAPGARRAPAQTRTRRMTAVPCHRLVDATSCHVVRIDIESLPTGMLIPSARAKSSATARTVS